MRIELNPLHWSWGKKTAVLVLVLLTILVAAPIFHMVRWQTYIWLPGNVFSTAVSEIAPDSQKHLIFVMVDHYEHGGSKNKEGGARDNEVWCDKFKKLSDGYRDDFGNRFRYTWFYPFDHHNDAIMKRLSKMAFDGYGEIEMHWHLTSKSGITKETFPNELRMAIEWYQKFGAMINGETDVQTAFAYVAGKWDLDASRNSPESHGITNQIQVLFDQGCYADFTFSTIGTISQPSKVNSIYYVQDDPDSPKSYNDGIDSKVGQPIDNRLMIFQGPMLAKWFMVSEYGAVESDPRFHFERVDDWVEANIHVTGRPEWVFVKVYSHGAQSSEVVLDHDMELMLKSLKQRCHERAIKLHFMTTREAYNVVKAAEDGKTGNPEDFRDHKIARPQNMITDFSKSNSVEGSNVN